ncbi:hypothetical protein AB4525_18675, partial [Vibrio breoganii]
SYKLQAVSFRFWDESTIPSFPHVFSGNLVGEEIPDKNAGPEKHSGMTSRGKAYPSRYNSLN